MDGERYRVVAVPTSGDASALVIAQSLDSQQEVLAKLGVVMLLFGLAGVIAAAMAGWAVARNGLRPVRRLTISAEHIARTEDLTPLPVEGADEIARLAAAFNRMLTALSASRDRQRQLVADAGHELRTPLTSLRTNIDLLAQADASGGLPAEARSELLADLRAQTEELTTLIGDLVELARDEPLAHVVESVDLAEIVDRAVARVRRRAPGVTFDVRTSPWWVVGEPPALERAVTNLLDNAAKWGPADGTVTVRLAEGAVVVDDEGPGIAPEDLPHVFERFYRSEESRSMPGSGLGLSIVQQVASRHAGSTEAVASPHGGARLVFRLPGAPEPRPVDARGAGPAAGGRGRLVTARHALGLPGLLLALLLPLAACGGSDGEASARSTDGRLGGRVGRGWGDPRGVEPLRGPERGPGRHGARRRRHARHRHGRGAALRVPAGRGGRADPERHLPVVRRRPRRGVRVDGPRRRRGHRAPGARRGRRAPGRERQPQGHPGDRVRPDRRPGRDRERRPARVVRAAGRRPGHPGGARHAGRATPRRPRPRRQRRPAQ